MAKINFVAKVEPYKSMLVEEVKLPENQIRQVKKGLQVPDRTVYLFAKASGLKSKKTRLIKKRGKQVVESALRLAMKK